MAPVPEAIQPLVRAWLDATPKVEALNPKLKQDWIRAICVSDFLRTALAKDETLFDQLMPGGELAQQMTYVALSKEFESRIADCDTDASLMRKSRQFRNKHMVRIAWGDLSGAFDLSTVMQELSNLADIVLLKILQKLMAWQVNEMGQPQDNQQNPQSLIIIALGKLGGKELNFSSDVDLMFAYPRPGATTKAVDNERFFTKLAQRFIHVVHTVTEDGFVFRVDMRLRPFGDAGSLVKNFAEYANYYQEQGRQWERYALVKARCLSQDKKPLGELNALIKSFVYRRYVDYGAIESLRELKRLIEREVVLKNLQDDIKRGPGGIREIEFIAQVFQLIRGGSERRLQHRKCLSVLRYLQRQGTLDPTIVDELTNAYIFLRTVEHRLQMVRDQQTHTLPHNLEAQCALAFSLGFADWAEFAMVLAAHRDKVALHFANMLQPAALQPVYCDVQYGFVKLWQNQLNDEESIAQLNTMDLPGVELWPLLKAFRDSYRCRQLQGEAKHRLTAVLPQVLHNIQKVPDPTQALMRMIQLLEAIVRRSAYLALLLEYPAALARLTECIARSTWIAEKVSAFPFLLDEFTRDGRLTKPIGALVLSDKLRQILLGIPEQEFEEQRETVRAFKLRYELRTAIADVEGSLALMKVSDQLSFNAEAVLGAAKDIVTKELAETPGLTDQFAIIAYGKLGGLEMSYNSDLDLVFLHDMGLCDAPIRMAQRIIHLLNTRTHQGVLYQVDTRLRPSGAAGLLVSSMDAFIEYQMTAAWLWEHQALIRARFICGSVQLEERFTAARLTILCQARENDVVCQQVSQMRDKMRVQHKTQRDHFDLKNVEGGITDIEFITHYLALSHAHAHPIVVKWTDTIRILEALGDTGCLAPLVSAQLIQIYQAYRAHLHQLILTGAPPEADDALFQAERTFVAGVWQKLFMHGN